MASLSRQLAQWVAGLRYEDIPLKVKDRAKGVTLHSLASTLLGHQTPGGQKAMNNLIIGADTMVVLKNKIIGKPTDIENARQILRQLSGQEHEVITGITVVHSQILSASKISRVRMKNLSLKDINSYVESGESMDKAGAYAIQGEGSFLVESYSGSYTNIIGLPMELLEDLLQKSNFSI